MSRISVDVIVATNALIDTAYAGDVAAAEKWLKEGADIDFVQAETGLSPLHIAIGRNHFALAKLLIEKGAAICPDRQGRWPSTIAELCEVDAELCDLVADAEMKLDAV